MQATGTHSVAEEEKKKLLLVEIQEGFMREVAFIWFFKHEQYVYMWRL